jgi:sarcosine oxidase
MTDQNYDAIVVGVGAMGASACFHLAARGARVLGLEQFDIPHERGSSHGFSRMIRAAYYEEPRYVPLLLRAYKLWEELERIADRKILHQVGGLFIGPPEGMLVGNSRLAAEHHGLRHEIFGADELRRRQPVFTIPDEWNALYDPMAGFLLPELAISTFAEQAMLHGAVIRTQQAVREWHADERSVTVQTDDATYHADHLILTAGAWISRLLGSLRIKLTVTRQVLGWVKPNETKPFRLGTFPVWGIDSLDGGIYYGFPMIPQVPGLKVAHHLPGKPFDPDQISRDPVAEDEEDFRLALRKYIPAGNGPLIAMRLCMYTNSPDHHFIIDAHPNHERVSIACGFSGHGFKFASVIGEILARQAIEKTWDPDVSFLKLGRASLISA